MDIEEFSNAVLREVLDIAGRSFDVRITENPKNNGVVRPALSAVMPGEAGGPSIFLDEYFEEYKDGGMGAREAAGDIYRKIMERGYGLKEFDLSILRKWDAARPHIYAKLVNREMNKGSLAGIPHRDFLDLAVIYYVEVGGIKDGNGMASFRVEDRHMEVWGQDEEGLYCAACSNMRISGQPIFENMDKVIRELMQDEVPFAGWEDLPDSNAYVLTNRKKLFGAAELLDGNTLKEIGDKLGSDYMVLPSSVHECIIVPSDEGTSCEELADIVCEVNREQVLMEERLSDHVYLYDREGRELKIAA